MGILDRLSKDRASFIGLHDMLTAVAAANQCSYSDAARGINSIICKINLDDLPIAYIYCFDSTFRQEVRLGSDECFMQCNDLLMVFNFATRAENISFVDGVERIYIRDVEPGKLHKRLFTYGFEPRAIQEFLKKFDVEMNVENYQGRSAAPKELPLPWVAPTQSAVRSPFITVRQGVELISQGNGVSTGDAARQLIDLLNAAAHGGRPGLFERDGAALKKVAELEQRHTEVIQSLAALRSGPPADDRSDPLANTMRDIRRGRMVRAGIKGASWYDTEFTLYPRKIAVLDLVEVHAAEFKRFALLAPEVSSASLAPPEPVATTVEAVKPRGVQKKVMLQRHSARWPGIKSDMSDAAKNGLADAAKARSRGWNEAAALKWAGDNGRLLKVSEPTDLDALMRGGLASTRHTMGR